MNNCSKLHFLKAETHNEIIPNFKTLRYRDPLSQNKIYNKIQ